MPFIIRPHRRVPVCCPVTYEHRLRDGRGTIFNLSVRGWRLCGDLSLQPGDVCSLRVVLPTRQHITVAAGRVRWVQGHDCGIETLVMTDEAAATVNRYIQAHINATS